MDKVIKDGMVAVITSPEFGAGWSDHVPPAAIFHPTLVQLIQEDRHFEITGALFSSLFGGPPEAYYLGGSSSLIVEWVPEGAQFVILEYDGSESIALLDNFNWITA